MKTSTLLQSSDFTCLALSSHGKVPVYGYNRVATYQGKPTPGYGFHCDSAQEARNCVGGGPEFAAHHWNIYRMQADGPNVALDAPEGWRWAEWRIESFGFPGTNSESRGDFVGYHTNHPDRLVGGCIIEKPRYIHDLRIKRLGSPVQSLELPQFRSDAPIYIYVSQAHCSGYTWDVLNINVANRKWLNIAKLAFSISE